MKILILINIFIWICFSSFARPISYSGGYTLMQSNNPFSNSIHAHYSPSYKYSLGYRGEYFRHQSVAFNGLQLNNLIKRWNLPSAQGNIYFKSAIGDIYQSSNNAIAGFTGVAADFETRKYFISYQNRYYKSDKNIFSQFQQSARFGFAPYVANYNNLHSWLMIEVTHNPTSDIDQIVTTPLIRVFKGLHLAEFGISSNQRVIFNYIIRF